MSTIAKETNLLGPVGPGLPGTGMEVACHDAEPRPDISIVIVSWNARAYLLDCLNSITGHSDGVRYEIIVVDNASSDGSPEAVKALGMEKVRLIETGENLGFSKGNNVGIRHSNGRYYVLMNSDVVLKPGCLKELIAFMDAHPLAGIAGPRLYNGDGTFQASCRVEPRLRSHLARACFLNTSLADPAYLGKSTKNVEVLAGSFWIVRREAADKVGLLDENFFFYGEDVDWCRRFRTGGWEICFHPNAEAIHFGGASSSVDSGRFNLELLKASLQLWEKYHSRLSSLAYLAVGLLYHVLRFALCTLRRLRPATRHGAGEKRAQHLAAIRWILSEAWKRITLRETTIKP